MKVISLFGKNVLSYGEVESNIGSHISTGHMLATTEHAEAMNARTLRDVVTTEPLLYKAIYKKNYDTVRNWFKVLPEDEDKETPDYIKKLVYNFETRNNFKYILSQAGVRANIYGTGFIERTYMGEGAKPALDSRPRPTLKPKGILVQDSERITDREKKKTRGAKTKYWVYRDAGVPKLLIHPDRLEPVVIDRTNNKSFGISKVNIVRNILKSKMDSDVSAGDILNWVGNGLYDVTIDNMQDDQEEKAREQLKLRPNFVLHDEQYKLEVKNPTTLNPKPFYDNFYVNIAAAMVMPTHMLTGISPGNVTGSETGYADYIHDIESIQELLYTPIVTKFYKRLVETSGHSWKYKIKWNPCFIDELSEAKILQTRTFSAVQLMNANIISGKEARMMINNGVIRLDPDAVPKPKPILNPKTGTEPNAEPQPVVKPKQDKAKMEENTYTHLEYNEMLAQDARLQKAEKISGKII